MIFCTSVRINNCSLYHSFLFSSRIMKIDGEFVLSFARRNVPIDKVWEQAIHMNLGLTEVLDVEQDSGESIYSIKFLDF